MLKLQKYVVMHDYGHVEGWKIVGQYDSILEAAEARDDDMRSMGGGEVHIFEWLHPFDAYAKADYKRQQLERERREAKT